MENKRNYGIDLLRIVSMLMVCMLHILAQGGAMQLVEYGSVQHKTAMMLNVLSFGAVNCYALVSGYVGVNAGVRYRNIIRLWMQAFFYSFGIAFVFYCCGMGNVGIGRLLEAGRPVISTQYWYFTGYFCLFFFTPFLNQMLKSMSENNMIKMVILILFFFSFLQTASWEMFRTGDGYSLWWLLLLYVLGGCMRRLSITEKIPKWLCLATYLIGAAIAWKKGGRLVSFISPAILLGSMALVIFFSRLHLRQWACKVISRLAPLAFGVYLIHVHPLVFEYVMKNRFAPLGSLNPISFVAALLGSTLGLYAVCTVIEAARSLLFKWLRINLLCEKIEKLLLRIEDILLGKLLVKS